MSEVSDVALRRKQAFLKAKEEAGGAQELVDAIKNQPWQVYFNTDGDIVCFTNNNEASPEPEWLSYEFTKEQVSILFDKDLRKYRIKQDPVEENVFSIELRPIETIYVQADKDFQYEIEESNTRKWDLKLEVFKSKLRFTLSKAQKEKYKDIYPISATVNGQRLFKFAITAPKNPHFMFQYEVIALADLITNKYVEVDAECDFRDHSIYTNKVFDTYAKKLK